MQSRISVSLAQCGGDPGEAPPIFRPRDRPPPLSKGLDDRQLLPPPSLGWGGPPPPPPPPPPPLSQGLKVWIRH